MKKVAVIGSGISGLATAWFLHRDFEVTVYEASAHAGGHANTKIVREEDRSIPVDTGFMVFNHVTYPNLVRLFSILDVPTKPTDMSFSVQHRSRELEYCGSSLNHLFAQRRNLVRPSFYRMLLQIDRFNREAMAALTDPSVRAMTLKDYVHKRSYGEDFFHLYLIPMSSAVWSSPPEEMLRFPAATLLRFFHNHGFLGLHTQHPWWTVEGGAKTYVERLTAPFRQRLRLNDPVHAVQRMSGRRTQVHAQSGTHDFDKVVFACHPPEALKILSQDATPIERRLLRAFRYQPNRATLHADAAVMPRTRRAWSSWNYRIDGDNERPDQRATPFGNVSTHYWMNRLQQVSNRRNYIVSINGGRLVAPEKTIETIDYEHPLFDLAASAAQNDIADVNTLAENRTETYFVGAWQRYGFHEDGLLSAVNLTTQILGRDPWIGQS